MYKYAKSSKAFTVIELLIIAPIVVLFIGAFISVIVGMTGEVLANKSANILTYDIQDALSRIDSDIKSSTSFLATNSISITSPQGYDDASAAFTNVSDLNGNMLIINSVATSTNPLSTSSGYVYLADKPNSCASGLVDQNKPMSINIIYFVKNSSLWRRTIMPSDYATSGCATPWQQPTCTPNYTDTFFCKTQDTKLLDNVDPEDFVINYYASESSQSADPISIDANSLDSVRNASLGKMNTAVISLNIDKTAAGRAINRSESIRTTRITTNITKAENQPADTIPLPPTTINAKVDPSSPDSVIFDWSRSDGATSYDIDKDIGSGWTSASTGSNSTIIAIKNYQGGSACVRVYARNSAGQSASTIKCLDIPTWQPLVLQDNWNNYAQNFTSAAYTKTSSGEVILKGLIKGGSAAAWTVIANLPNGYRPSERSIFTSSSQDSLGRVDVAPDGSIVFVNGYAGWFSLNNIRFMPASTNYTALATVNSWVNYGDGWATAGYTQDSAGKVYVKGLIKSGTTTAYTPITATLPSSPNLRPTEDLYMPVVSSAGFGSIKVRNPGELQIVAGSNGWLSLENTFLPLSYSGTWNNISLINSWVNFGSPMPSASYTKTSDGVVVLKGFIKSGTAWTVAGVLPPGFRPKEGTIFTSDAWDSYARIDVNSNGTIIVGSIANNGWVALNSISFLAEQ